MVRSVMSKSKSIGKKKFSYLSGSIKSFIFGDTLLDTGLSFLDEAFGGAAGGDWGDALGAIVQGYRYCKKFGFVWTSILLLENIGFGLIFIPGLGNVFEYFFNLLPTTFFINLLYTHRMKKATKVYPEAKEKIATLRDTYPDDESLKGLESDLESAREVFEEGSIWKGRMGSAKMFKNVLRDAEERITEEEEAEESADFEEAKKVDEGAVEEIKHLKEEYKDNMDKLEEIEEKLEEIREEDRERKTLLSMNKSEEELEEKKKSIQDKAEKIEETLKTLVTVTSGFENDVEEKKRKVNNLISEEEFSKAHDEIKELASLVKAFYQNFENLEVKMLGEYASKKE